MSKPAQNVGHTCVCSAQEAICFLGVAFSFSLLSTSALEPLRVLFYHAVHLSVFFQHLSALLSSAEEEESMHTCSLRPFPMILSQGEPVLFLVPFLPALGTVSKGASVFLLNEAWYSFLAGRDNGPHMVVL